MATTKQYGICCEDIEQSTGSSSTIHLPVSQYWTAHCGHVDMHDHCIQRHLKTSASCPLCSQAYTVSGLRKECPQLREYWEKQDYLKVVRMLHAYFPGLDPWECFSSLAARAQAMNMIENFDDHPDAALCKLILADIGLRCDLLAESLALVQSAKQFPHKLTKVEYADALRLEWLLGFPVHDGANEVLMKEAVALDPASSIYINLIDMDILAWRPRVLPIEQPFASVRKFTDDAVQNIEEGKVPPHF